VGVPDSRQETEGQKATKYPAIRESCRNFEQEQQLTYDHKYASSKDKSSTKTGLSKTSETKAIDSKSRDYGYRNDCNKRRE
jgi:hypothetical protein